MTRRAAATVTLALATAACVGGDDFAADRARVDGEAIERSGAGAGSRWDRLAFAPGAALPEEAVARLGAELEVDDAVALAFACHAGLAAHLERLGVARAELRQAALPRNPVLTASWKFFAGPDEIELTLSQSFLDLLFLPLRRRVAEAGRAAVEAEVIAALVHQAFAVRRAHATALHAVGQYRLARDAAAAALAHAELMDQLHEAGSVVDERRTTAAILAERAADGAAAAEHDRVAAELALARAIGLPVDAPPARVAKVAGSAPQPPLPDALARPDHELVTQATQRSLALAVARARTEAAAARAGVEPAQRWLDPAEVGIAAKRETSGEWGLGPVAALALPLFDLGGNARIAAAAELRRTELDTTALERELARAVQEAAAAARSLAARAAAARDRDVPLHARLVHETVQRYSAMQIGAFDVLAVRDRELAAESRAATLAHAAALARLEVEEWLAGGWPASAVAGAALRMAGAAEGMDGPAAPAAGEH